MEEGEPTLVGTPISDAVAEITEFTWTSTPEEAIERITGDVEANDRYEIQAINSEGRVVAGAVITADDDCQVGELISVQWCYVSPGYRGRVGIKMIKLAWELAERTGYRVMAFTHRRAEGRYEINYRKLGGPKDGQESKEDR
ncbi:GNAT family N-acetyltransferase [Pseudomonas sp. B14(2017)]|uniref:GNAT family N-acetyltransferase n=1 Tax=Pseudomonas sp. B14(2017) TaxID=1981745 RepID=UPI00117B4735|nr:GNAT family N-acetyltransferase [Pseudomonas sp. B14(2017)]